MNKVVHFEIPAEDLPRARSFYGSLFGWELPEMIMDDGTSYTIVRTVPVDDQQMPTEPGAINGGMMQRTAETPAPVVTVAVESVDDTLQQVEAGGGSVVRPRSEIPGMGAFAYFRDTEGNVVGLWENLA
jgi:predicted enzyme related to lactoylglutathione lyase